MNPDQYTISEQFLNVGGGHELYIQEWGNVKAKTPIIFLHGGPGSGVKDKYRDQFAPTQHRVIFFDQRGSGRSIPTGSLVHNTTQDLVEDIEKIAKFFRISSFVLTGGSWGSCLALSYAIKYPNRVEALVLRGIFTGTKTEMDWVNKGHFKTFFPDVWDKFLAKTPKKYAHNPVQYHIPRIVGPVAQAAKESAYIYGNLESALLNLDDRFTPANIDDYDPTMSKLEAHYLSHNCFLTDNYILNHAQQLTMPIWLIQGRYDMVCPPITAYRLHQRLPNSQLIWTIAGHGNDRPNYDVNRTILLQWG
jgi:proline iminopeptidase